MIDDRAVGDGLKRGHGAQLAVSALGTVSAEVVKVDSSLTDEPGPLTKRWRRGVGV